jgi:hypothetical protein
VTERSVEIVHYMIGHYFKFEVFYGIPALSPTLTTSDSAGHPLFIPPFFVVVKVLYHATLPSHREQLLFIHPHHPLKFPIPKLSVRIENKCLSTGFNGLDDKRQSSTVGKYLD